MSKYIKFSEDMFVRIKVFKSILKVIITLILINESFVFLRESDTIQNFCGLGILILVMLYYTPKVIKLFKREEV